MTPRALLTRDACPDCGGLGYRFTLGRDGGAVLLEVTLCQCATVAELADEPKSGRLPDQCPDGASAADSTTKAEGGKSL